MEKTPDAMMDEDARRDDARDAGCNDGVNARRHDAMRRLSAMMEKTPDAMMDKTPDAMMEMPALVQRGILPNAATGETFKIQDFKGKVVLVETMAMWCPTCLTPSKRSEGAARSAGRTRRFGHASASTLISTRICADLKDYTAKNGFDWTYTVATRRCGARDRQSVRPAVPQSALHADVHHRSARRGASAAVRREERRRSAEGAGTVLERSDVRVKTIHESSRSYTNEIVPLWRFVVFVDHIRRTHVLSRSTDGV